ncbi:MAG: peptide deformylase [Ignavibacteriaceae bacterium]
MKKYTLKIYPDSVLRETSRPVTEINGNTWRLLKGMCGIMYTHKGIGLAAPQVGVLQRVIIADIGNGLISMINPEILTGFGEDFLEEGCLSLPEIFVSIKRNQSILVRYTDIHEKEKEQELTGLTARVIQHEVDHLNGILITDYQSLAERLHSMVKHKVAQNEK